MRNIDIKTWPRRKHFELFNAFDFPHFNMCANVDITSFDDWVKEHTFSFTVAIVYVLARAANELTAFRYRVKEDQVVEHDVVHPSPTILTDGDLFSFSTINYIKDFRSFVERAEKTIATFKENPTLEDPPGQDNLLYMTSIPWVSFTSFMHPIHMHPADSVPRLAWGKFFSENDFKRMPLSVQVHHALMDGYHVGQYYSLVQKFLDQPERLLEVA
jgi:chloramphenicol O-acetyltransferase type A